MTNELAKKRCTSCRSGEGLLSPPQLTELLQQLDGWVVDTDNRLRKTFKFRDFTGGLQWLNQVGVIADSENHHPDCKLSWGKVQIELWTHDANGLTENDFIVAAKIDEIAPKA